MRDKNDNRAKDFHLKNWVLRLVAIDISLVHLDNRKTGA